MNGFAFRHVRAGLCFFAEYRLAHWSGFRPVRGPDGEPVEYADACDARLSAAHELVAALNGNQRFWHGTNSGEARTAAELLFKSRVENDQGTDQGATAGQAAPGGRARAQRPAAAGERDRDQAGQH